MDSKWAMAFTAGKISGLIDTLSKAKCEYRVVDATYIASLEYPSLARDNHGEPIQPGSAYMAITCANGHMYYINVTADSPYAACAEVFNFIQYRM